MDNEKLLLNYLLISSIINGNFEETKKLISNGADVKLADTDGITPLQLAESQGNSEIAKLLIENGADRDTASKYPALVDILDKNIALHVDSNRVNMQKISTLKDQGLKISFSSPSSYSQIPQNRAEIRAMGVYFFKIPCHENEATNSGFINCQTRINTSL
jgi:ankyrin repeat protein